MSKKALDKDRLTSLEAGRTVVVNVRREDADVYVGRNHPKAPQLPGRDGFFGNRMKDQKYIEPFVEDFFKRLLHEPGFIDRMKELDGKRLGCWCYPNMCHAMIYSVWCNCTAFEQRRIVKMAKDNLDDAVALLVESALHWWGT
jgi:hypothetical protein